MSLTPQSNSIMETVKHQAAVQDAFRSFRYCPTWSIQFLISERCSAPNCVLNSKVKAPPVLNLRWSNEPLLLTTGLTVNARSAHRSCSTINPSPPAYLFKYQTLYNHFLSLPQTLQRGHIFNRQELSDGAHSISISGQNCWRNGKVFLLVRSHCG